MQVKHIMSKNPDFVRPNTSLKEAASAMKNNDFGFLPIGDGDKLIGILTDRDIAIRAVAKGKDPNKTAVKDIMTEKVFYCYEDDDIEKAAKYMCESQIRRLIVLNKDKRLTGVLSLGDLATRSQDEKLSAHVIEEVSETVH